MKTPEEHTAEKKIGCVQHDCDECQQREKNPEQPPTYPVAESQALELSESSDAGVAPRQDGRGPDAVGVPDLIKRLNKEWQNHINMPTSIAVCLRQAADALAALQAECDALKADNAELDGAISLVVKELQKVGEERDALKAMCEELADAYLALLALGYKDTGALSKWQEMRDEATK